MDDDDKPRALLHICMKFGRFGAPILRHFGTNRCKKISSRKKVEQVTKKGFASSVRKTSLGGVGPLKQDK